jgi:hypothetical protein
MTASTRIRPAQCPTSDAARGRLRTRSTAEPVFLDRTGRRRRLVAALSAAAALLLAVVVLALLAGLTGMGAHSIPGWPAANGQPQRLQATPRRAEPAPSPAITSTATYRHSSHTTVPARQTGQPSSAARSTATPSAAAPATPTASATPTGKAHGRNPSHTPNPHASKAR